MIDPFHAGPHDLFARDKIEPNSDADAATSRHDWAFPIPTRTAEIQQFAQAHLKRILMSHSLNDVTLVLVHGAWHGAWVWDDLRAEMTDYTTEAVELPSSGYDPEQLGSFADDVDIIRTTVQKIAKPVVVIAHSYGGLPTTQALCGLDNVIGVVYIAAWVLDVGQSAAIIAGEQGLPDWWEVHPEGGYMDALRPTEVFYNDLDPERARTFSVRLAHQSLDGAAHALEDAVWKYVPTSYILCERDAGLAPSIQQLMSRHTSKTTSFDTGHNPFLSRPSAVAAQIREDVAEFLEGRCRI
ncbi:alpha/beta hydrolase [Rhodococcoides fascians]|uniref:alpha/beta hydrolase n=1 Tax=Rhodococcoides fascians TaxID=1828 RepID=UPI001427E905